MATPSVLKKRLVVTWIYQNDIQAYEKMLQILSREQPQEWLGVNLISNFSCSVYLKCKVYVILYRCEYIKGIHGSEEEQDKS